MSDDKSVAAGNVLSKVEVSRRGFVKSLTIGTAFAVPFIASYSMDGLRVNMANAGSSSNMSGHGGPFGFIRHLIHKLFRIFHRHGGNGDV